MKRSIAIHFNRKESKIDRKQKQIMGIKKREQVRRPTGTLAKKIGLVWHPKKMLLEKSFEACRHPGPSQEGNDIVLGLIWVDRSNGRKKDK